MSRVYGLLAAFLLAGCGHTTVRLDFGLESSSGTFGGTSSGYTLNAVTIEPGFYGRGCFDMEVERDGDVRITLQQDGTSDWIIGRAIPAMGREITVAALSFASAPWDLLRTALGLPTPRPEPPSEIHGCQGVLED
jgi:hypothetical protein